MTLKEKYNKIQHKREFAKCIGNKINVEFSTIEVYFNSEKGVPAKHLDLLDKAIDIQLAFDEKVKSEQSELFDEL